MFEGCATDGAIDETAEQERAGHLRERASDEERGEDADLPAHAGEVKAKQGNEPGWGAVHGTSNASGRSNGKVPGTVVPGGGQD